MTVNSSTLTRLFRHVVAAIGTTFGVLTQSVTALHLPVAVSAVLTASYPLLVLLEHYADVSTTPPPVVVAPVTVEP